MTKRGIKDRVAIMGVGCTKFGENWEMNPEDMLIEAVYEAYEDAGIKDQQEEIDQAWVGVQYYFTGLAGCTLSDAIKLYGKPITRVENFCASGTDSFRNACYAVASGVCEIALATGVEKLLDEGSSGLPGFREFGHPTLPLPSAPAMFSMAATRCMHEWGWTKEDLALVAVKNHRHGKHHPKAHFRKEIDLDSVMSAPMIADPLGRFDCCAVSDGSAAAIITTPEIAQSYNHANDYVLVKSNALSVDTMAPWYKPSYSFTSFPSTRNAAKLAYHEADIKDPREEISFAEVHDCFTITELINVQDLGFSEFGKAPEDLRAGRFNIEGEQPIGPSGSLKCFGHPIGATGVRQIYEATKQLQGRADGLQVKDPKLGLTHNLGGAYTVASVTILGKNDK
ncbi:MAG: acetyl-CoA acetyltransferase [Candidatus Lokiarchaeota archaeon]|nr:acetyl-CoA acetyltransferase [Candidatus Lokiarchaeota archaeon]